MWEIASILSFSRGRFEDQRPAAPDGDLLQRRLQHPPLSGISRGEPPERLHLGRVGQHGGEKVEELRLLVLVPPPHGRVLEPSGECIGRRWRIREVPCRRIGAHLIVTELVGSLAHNAQHPLARVGERCGHVRPELGGGEPMLALGHHRPSKLRELDHREFPAVREYKPVEYARIKLKPVARQPVGRHATLQQVSDEPHVIA